MATCVPLSVCSVNDYRRYNNACIFFSREWEKQLMFSIEQGRLIFNQGAHTVAGGGAQIGAGLQPWLLWMMGRHMSEQQVVQFDMKRGLSAELCPTVDEWDGWKLIIELTWHNFYGGYARRMSVRVWSHGSSQQIEDGGGRCLELRKNVINYGLDKDVCTAPTSSQSIIWSMVFVEQQAFSKSL